MFGFSQLDWLLASDDCLPIPLRPLGPQLSIAGLAMKFGHRALLVPAPAVNSYILIALARAAVDFAASASRCLRCFRVFCALCTPAFDRCWCHILALVPAFCHAATVSEGAASICRLCPFLWYWFGDTAFGPPAIDCGPCHEAWPSGPSCSGSCRQLGDLHCPRAPRLPLRIPRLDRPLCLAPSGSPPPTLVPRLQGRLHGAA
jgi:hypothetical protein